MSESLGFVLRRAASALATLLLSSLIIFAAIHALPGGYADVFLGAYATPEAKARIERRFGLNDTLPAQYVKWLKAAAQGDFGVSLVTQRPVAEEFAARLPATARIASLAAALALLIGGPAGLLAGLFDGSAVAHVVSRLCGSLAISVPDFVIGTLLLFLVSRVFPAAAGLSGTILPALSLSALGIGLIMTAARHSSIAVGRGPFVRAAAARGASPLQILGRHVVRNAAIPVATVFGVYFGYLLGGTAIVEATFTVPGVGRYLLQAVQLRDYPVVQAGALIAASVFVALNLIVDLAYGWLDPRIRNPR
jgi:peptide/nickel transport system permease protein